MQPVHIISPFSSWETEGGVWWHALEIFESLKKIAKVELWTELEPNPKLSSYPIQRIRPFRGEMPRNGTFIFVGMAQLPGNWYDHTAPNKVMLECTMFAAPRLYRALNRLSLDGKRSVDVGFCSELTKKLCALPGIVRVPCPGLEPFFQIQRNPTMRSFTIGKVSRNSLQKHHFRDISLYKKLVSAGCRVNIVGGICLAPYLEEEVEGLQLLPERPRGDLPEFLAGLDCFFYRTSLHYLENIGTVIVEAMASGLPVVAHRQGGYVDIVHHGENGYLFDTNEEAYAFLHELSLHPSLVQEMGRNAREMALKCQAASWTGRVTKNGGVTELGSFE